MERELVTCTGDSILLQSYIGNKVLLCAYGEYDGYEIELSLTDLEWLVTTIQEFKPQLEHKNYKEL